MKLLAIATAVALVLTACDWPMFRYGPDHRGSSPDTSISPAMFSRLGLDWFASVDDPLVDGFGSASSPAVVKGVIYEVSSGGTLYAFDATTGASRWTATTGGAISGGSSPAVANGIVYVGSRDGKLYAFDATTGTSRWTATTGIAISSSPAVANGIVYVGSFDGKLYAFDANTGATKWTASTGGRIRSSPAVANGVVYVGSDDDNLYAFDATTGATRWLTTPGGTAQLPISSSPAVADGIVYTFDGINAFAYTADNGALIWIRNIEGTAVNRSASPAVANGLVYFVGQGGVEALDAQSGVVRWSARTGAPSASPAVVNGVVYTTSPTTSNNVGTAYAFDANTGATEWASTLGVSCCPPSTPIVANGFLYLTDGYLLAFATGGPLGGAVTPPTTYGGSNASIPGACECVRNTPRPVNTATGDFWHSFDDLAIPGRGIPLSFSRTYNSLTPIDGPLGFGWTDSYSMSLTVDAAQGNATITQENGSQVTFTPGSGGTYTAAPRVIATLVKNGDGSFTFTRRARQTFTFNASGQLTGERDLNGYVTSLAYNGSGQLSTVTDPAGRQLILTYTGVHITSVADSTGRQVLFGYNDGQGNLTDVTDVGLGVTHFDYDAQHRLTQMVDPNQTVLPLAQQHPLVNDYDAQGRVAFQTDPMGRKTTFTYNGSQTTVTDPRGNVTVDQYKFGELTSETRGFGSSQAATWTYAYDPATLGVASVRDPNGHVTSMTYDNAANLKTNVDALGRQTAYTYDALNDPTSVTDPNGVTTTNVYDVNGNLRSVSTPLIGSNPPQVQTTTYHYNDAGHPGDITSTTDPNGKTWTTSYDAFGYLVTATDPVGDITTYGYDTAGRRTSVVSPKGNVIGGTPAAFRTTYGYNAFGDQTRVTDPLNHQSMQTYDADRNLKTFTDADNNTTIFGYDLDNEGTKTTRADGTIVQTGYDDAGNVASQIDGAGHATTFTYDALDRQATVTDPLGRVTTYGYDGAGNRIRVIDPDGQTTTSGHDAANEPTTITYSDGRTPNVTNIGYDNDGQRTSMTDGTGTSHWTWDSLHRMTSSTNGGGQTVGYGYDLKGQLTSIVYPGGTNTVTRTYDDAGRIIRIADWLGHQTVFTPDPNSNLATETYPNGTSVTSTFDNADNLSTITDKKAGTAFASFSYGRDHNNQLASTSQTGVPGGNETYLYTALNQLKNVNSAAYGYDTADNITGLASGATLAYDTANEVKTLTAGFFQATYGYDNRGNRITASSPLGATTYGYDQANRLTSVGTNASYTYNGDGVRMSKTVAGIPEPFVWDQGEGLPLLLKDGTTSYVYGPGGIPLEQISATNAVLYYHHDQLGSTRIITDSTGGVAATYTYDAYGQQTGATGSTTTPFGFGGQYSDAESGLYYLRARYYDPSTAQFTARDPAVGVTRSPYRYVAGNPLNATDPNGLCGLWGEDTCLQDIADAFVNSDIAPFANGWANGVTFGLASRIEAGTDNGRANLAAEQCSPLYGLGNLVGSLNTFAFGGSWDIVPTGPAAGAADGARVLGHFPEYVQVGKGGAKYFSIPENIWRSMSADEKWAANQKFLDRGIAAGDIFRLSTSVDAMRIGSPYMDEMNYMLKNGYWFNTNGSALVPGWVR